MRYFLHNKDKSVQNKIVDSFAHMLENFLKFCDLLRCQPGELGDHGDFQALRFHRLRDLIDFAFDLPFRIPRDGREPV